MKTGNRGRWKTRGNGSHWIVVSELVQWKNENIAVRFRKDCAEVSYQKEASGLKITENNYGVRALALVAHSQRNIWLNRLDNWFMNTYGHALCTLYIGYASFSCIATLCKHFLTWFEQIDVAWSDLIFSLLPFINIFASQTRSLLF